MPARAHIAALAALLAVTAAEADTLTYENGRFGTRLTFPAEIFDAIDPPPVNGDGRRFRAADGAEVAAWGQFNTLDQTPETLLEWKAGIAAEEGATVTYSAAGNGWAVISGTSGDEIFYERHEFSASGDVIHSMELRYPASSTARYDPLVGAIAGSLEGP